MNTIKDIEKEKAFIAPSLLSANFANLEGEIQEAEQAGAKILHLDVMDGHFVPNLTIGPPVVSSIRKVSNMIFDVHLMLTNPIDFIEPFASAGANHITFHVESNSNPKETIELIRRHSMSAGLTVKPDTPIESIYPFLADIDMVLIMTVEPGFGGQLFMSDMLAKVEKLHKKLEPLQSKVHIEVDGGINAETVSVVANAGANILVAGNSVFNHKDGIKKAISYLQSQL